MQLPALVAAVVLPLLVLAVDPQAPITLLEGVNPQPAVFDVANWNKPLVIRSEKEAAKYFQDADLDRLTKQVDFAEQLLPIRIPAKCNSANDDQQEQRGHRKTEPAGSRERWI